MEIHDVFLGECINFNLKEAVNAAYRPLRTTN